MKHKFVFTDKEEKHWNYLMTDQIMRFKNFNQLMPPPFNIFYQIPKMLIYCKSKLYNQCERQESNQSIKYPKSKPLSELAKKSKLYMYPFGMLKYFDTNFSCTL